MAEEKREPPPDQEVQEILGDLDAILSDIGGGPGPTVPGGQPSSAPAGGGAPGPAAAPAAPESKPPAVAPVPAAPKETSIELGARSLPASRPPEKKPEPPASAPPKQPAPVLTPPPAAAVPPPAAPAPKPPAPAAPPPAAPAPEPPAPTAAPAPVAAPPPAVPARPVQKGAPPPDALPDIPAPDKITKDQIRRVAFIYLGKYEAERDAFAKLLDQTAQTVPKKPLFLRRVLYQPVTEEFGSAELLARAQQAKAAAVLGIVEGISEARLREWTEAFSGAGLMFRVIGPLDAGKKSVAIDIVVDAMLLACEAA